MKAVLDDLKEILKKQNSILNQLIEYGIAETQALKTDDLETLIKVTWQQQILCQDLTRFEHERITLQNRIACLLNVNAATLTLEIIISQTSNEEQQLFEETAENLQKNLNDLATLNETNRLLIKQSLAHTNSLFHKLHPEKITYNRLGLITNNLIISKLDKTV